MPRAPPTSRVVSFMAEPTPALLGGNDDTIASEAAGISIAMPAASITRPMASSDVGRVELHPGQVQEADGLQA